MAAGTQAPRPAARSPPAAGKTRPIPLYSNQIGANHDRLGQPDRGAHANPDRRWPNRLDDTDLAGAEPDKPPPLNGGRVMAPPPTRPTTKQTGVQRDGSAAGDREPHHRRNAGIAGCGTAHHHRKGIRHTSSSAPDWSTSTENTPDHTRRPCATQEVAVGRFPRSPALSRPKPRCVLFTDAQVVQHRA